mmetsp:Transcript_4231/g.10058  ORF Transcript_4231/g.10058 Transcript_4231/m.10058 type:complete len:523 (-) Transcript_4231:531-2099(-)
MTDQPTAPQATASKRFLSRRDEIQSWFDARTWSLSGDTCTSPHPTHDADAVPDADEHGCPAERQPAAGGRCRAKTVLFPTSTADLSAILGDLPPGTPVSVVCGGHSSSNASTAACAGAVVLDLHQLDQVRVDTDRRQVTVGGGVLTRQLVEAVRDAGGALPVGTGDIVGVAGYVTNGGISGYFQKRLGMMGQRAVQMTVVLADGTVRELTKGSSGSEEDQQLFRAMLGAGSALGVLTSLTLQMEREAIFRTGGNLVVACGTLEAAQTYARRALTFLRDAVLPNPSVSMELVVTADFTCIVTLVFYDTFEADPAEFAQDLREAGGDDVVVDDVAGWTTWYEAASSLWSVIAEMKGDPLIRTDHSMGTRRTSAQRPDDAVLDFVVDDWIGRMPFEAASQSIVEIRSLGGEAASQGNADLVPAGNAQCEFFADMIVAYDGRDQSSDERRQIQSRVNAIVGDAKKLGGDDSSSAVYVDFSATHSQPGGCGGSDVFGSDANYETIRSVKRTVDPLNRFRSHPFGKLL